MPSCKVRTDPDRRKLANKLNRWIKSNVFEIAALVAVLAVIVSCVGSFRALDDLPRIQKRLVALEEQLERLSGIRSTLGTSTLRSRMNSESGAVHDEVTATISRGEQLIADVLNGNPSARVKSLVLECRAQFSQITRFGELNETEVGETIETGRSLRSQLRSEVIDGRERLDEMRSSAAEQRSHAAWRLFGGHGLMFAVIGLLYFARRTEQRRRESADLKLLEADERFALIVRGSADGLMVADASGKIQVTNPALDEMFGADAGQLEGTLISSLFGTTVIDEWLTNRLDEEHDASPTRTVSAQRCDGEKINVELSITPQTIHQQDFLAISVRDVSEREVSRLRLKQHEALLREIPDPLHIVDATGTIIYWNVGAEGLYGYTPAESIGQSANDLLGILPPEGDHTNIHAPQYSEADRWTGELEAVTKDGRRLRVERRRTRITEGDDTIGEVIFDLDLGERKRLQRVQRRRQRLEALGTLASGIAHDLNNLLTPILMSSRMMQRGGANLDREALLDTVVSGASRGADLISQLLTFARGGDGQHHSVDASELLLEVAGILIHTIRNEVELELDIEPDLPEFVGDSTEISQVVMNLAINSRDSLPDGGILKISAASLRLESEHTYSLVTLQPGDYLKISVSDNGTGIPLDIRDRIFDPFFTTKERGQGTGLGLSTSLGIIRSHNGAIEVKSTVGEGTRMSVILPVLDETEDDDVREDS